MLSACEEAVPALLRAAACGHRLSVLEGQRFGGQLLSSSCSRAPWDVRNDGGMRVILSGLCVA